MRKLIKSRALLNCHDYVYARKYGDREGSAAKAAAYNAAYVAAYHNQAAATLQYAWRPPVWNSGGRQGRIVMVANVEEWHRQMFNSLQFSAL